MSLASLLACCSFNDGDLLGSCGVGHGLGLMEVGLLGSSVNDLLGTEVVDNTLKNCSSSALFGRSVKRPKLKKCTGTGVGCFVGIFVNVVSAGLGIDTSISLLSHQMRSCNRGKSVFLI